MHDERVKHGQEEEWYERHENHVHVNVVRDIDAYE